MFNSRDHLLSKDCWKSPPPPLLSPLKKSKEATTFALYIFALGVGGEKVGLLSKHAWSWMARK